MTFRDFITKEIKEILRENEKTHNLIVVRHPTDKTILMLYELVCYVDDDKKETWEYHINDIIRFSIGTKLCSLEVGSHSGKVLNFKIVDIPISKITEFLIPRIRGVEIKKDEETKEL